MARAWLRRLLESWGRSHLLLEASLVVSELVGNAVRHAGEVSSSIRLELTALADGLRLAVTDHSPARPVLRQPDADGGRGMHIIVQLARRWGVEEVRPRGKRVWVELA
jgi:anti-sigma regulatory factor (Ser/Thr protein kinase)